MKLRTIMGKELWEIVKNKLLLFTVGLPPIIFAIMPIGMMYAARMDPATPNELEVLYRMYPEMQGLDPMVATQVLLINQFSLMFLMIPALVPMVIASFSIIGEKQARSLEPLLATPVKVWELLLGKVLAAVIPAVGATWLGYAITLIGVYIVGTELAFQAALSPIWLLSIATLAPLLSLASVGLAVIVSSRVNDTRVAQQASIVLILPIIGIFVAQAAGGILVNTTTILLAALVLLILDVAVLFVAVRLFRRERILTDWR